MLDRHMNTRHVKGEWKGLRVAINNDGENKLVNRIDPKIEPKPNRVEIDYVKTGFESTETVG